MVKNDRWITEMAKKGMIEPFNGDQVRKGVVSYGVSAYGYDIRISDEFKLPNPVSKPGEKKVIDPKNFDESNFLDYKGDVCEIPANSYLICRSLEYLRIPRETLVLCFGNPYARSR
jgi:dCTP deaminase